MVVVHSLRIQTEASSHIFSRAQSDTSGKSKWLEENVPAYFSPPPPSFSFRFALLLSLAWPGFFFFVRTPAAVGEWTMRFSPSFPAQARLTPSGGHWGTSITLIRDAIGPPGRVVGPVGHFGLLDQ